MLLDLLKLFGLDVRAKIAQARTEFEQQVEHAKGRVVREVTTASVLAVIFAVAALSGLAAIGVGLSALYSWVSIHHGQFYGYAAVGGVLVVVSAALSAIGILEAKSWSAKSRSAKSWSAEPTAPRLNEKLARDTNDGESAVPIRAISAGDLEAPEPLAAAPISPAASLLPSNRDNGMSEVLGQLLSKFIRLPVTGNPVLDDVIADLREPARSVLEDAIKSTVDAIRYGERQKVIAALGTAVLVGWLLERVRSRQVAGR
jgi:hypothetical protein